MVLMLGGGGQARCDDGRKRSANLGCAGLYPRIDQIPAAFNPAGDPNVETLIGARPDVILMAYDGAFARSGVLQWRPTTCRSS